MGYYIFTTKKEAESYDAAVIAVSNFPAGDNWANPIKHPTKSKWAIIKSPKLQIEGKEAVELDESWTPPIDKI